MMELRTRGGACLHSMAYSPGKSKEKERGQHLLGEGVRETRLTLRSRAVSQSRVVLDVGSTEKLVVPGEEKGKREGRARQLDAPSSSKSSPSHVSKQDRRNSPLLCFLRHQPINDLLAHYPITSTLQALDPDALPVSLDLSLQIHPPALLTSSMSTSQRQRLRIDDIRCKVEAADGAGELLFGDVGRVGLEGGRSTRAGRGGS